MAPSPGWPRAEIKPVPRGQLWGCYPRGRRHHGADATSFVRPARLFANWSGASHRGRSEVAVGKRRSGPIPIGRSIESVPSWMISSVSVTCPVCSETLLRSGRSYACPNRHNFDLSREGYLSLLHGRSNYQHIGDDKQMVRARIRVHKLSAFQELAKAITSYGLRLDAHPRTLDVGCGDGFFLDHVVRAAGTPLQGVGVDVSKEALASAARNYPGMFFVRSDVSHHQLPFGDASFGLVLSVFAPRPIDEVRRVLTADGLWMIVTATQEHLREIREFLPLAAIGTDKLAAPTSRAFSILRGETFAYKSKVGHQDLVSMVEMSPSIHRVKRDLGAAWAERLPRELGVTFSFSLTLLGRAVR